MPPSGVFVSLPASNAEGSGEDRPPLRRFFLKPSVLIRLTRAISHYRRYAKDPKTIASRLTWEKSNIL